MVYSSHAGPYLQPRPPGPPGLPLIGNLLALGRDPLGFFTETTRRYGDLVSFNLAGWQTLLVSNLPAIEKILVEDHRSFIKNRFFWQCDRGVRRRPAHQ
jgi:Cytochrome P450